MKRGKLKEMLGALILKKRFLFLLLTVWLAVVFLAPLPDPSQDRRDGHPLPLSPEDLGNLTLAQNPFFASQWLLFPPPLRTNLTRFFEGVYVPPGELLVREGDPPAFFIVENGSLALVPTTLHEARDFVIDYRHGDGIGGLNVYYRVGFERGVRARHYSGGAFVWQATHPGFFEMLAANELMARGVEQQALEGFLEKSAKKPILLFPGFASTQLTSWRHKRCFGASILPGDRVWLNLEMLLHSNLFQEQCWLRCMMLDPVHQTDPFDCKIRPEEGLASISALIPGMLLGPITTIFKPFVTRLVEDLGYDVASLVAIPYDWRLAPTLLHQRDSLYSRIKMEFERAVETNNNHPSVVVCHSLGCTIFHYFLDWLALHLPDSWEAWVGQHVTMYYAVSAPFLGAAEPVKGELSGLTFGLPITDKTARLMGASWSSTFSMLPRHGNGYQDPPEERPPMQCPLEEEMGKPSQWPASLVTIRFEGGVEMNFSVDDIASGRMLEQLSKLIPEDQILPQALKALVRYYHEDPLNPLLRAPSRPPIKKIVIVHGRNLETDLAYVYSYSNTTGLVLQESIIEGAGGVLWKRKHGLINGDTKIGQSPYKKSGDTTVPFTSLTWANTWHFPNVHVTDNPPSQRVSIDRLLSAMPDIERSAPWKLLQTINTLQPAYTKYESSSKNGDQDIVVLEVEGVSHRDAIKNEFFIQLFKEELFWMARKEILGRHTKAANADSLKKIWENSILHDLTPPSWFNPEEPSHPQPPPEDEDLTSMAEEERLVEIKNKDELESKEGEAALESELDKSLGES